MTKPRFQTADTSIASDRDARLATIVANVLPDHSRVAYYDNDQQHAEDLSHGGALTDQLIEAVTHRNTLKADIAFTEKSHQEAAKGPTAADAARLESKRARLAALNDKIARLDAQQKQPRGRAYNRETLDDFLLSQVWHRECEPIDDPNHHGATVVTKMLAPVIFDARIEVTPKKGQSDGDGLTESVAALSILREERKALGAMPPSLDEIGAEIVENVKAMGRKGVPDFQYLLKRRVRHLGDTAKVGRLRWPGEHVYEPWDAQGAVAFMCFIDPEGVAARIKEAFRQRHGAQVSTAMDSKQRDARATELEAQVAHHERVVESWAARCQRAGVSYVRNWKSRPEAFLGIKVEDSEFG